jgi:D-alanyl-lipoteichoic acid acyltransferase DltB (MBOAT superfamily)
VPPKPAFGFGLQIYFDFNGYSQMARGVSRVLGIELTTNFRTPSLATSFRDFWTRWHISLSQWLRDYVYIPFGGNRASALMRYRNLLLTMLIGGLWHGAGWNFVIWGRATRHVSRRKHGIQSLLARPTRRRDPESASRGSRLGRHLRRRHVRMAVLPHRGVP